MEEDDTFEKVLKFIRSTHPDERTPLESDILVMADAHKATARRMAESWLWTH